MEDIDTTEQIETPDPHSARNDIRKALGMEELSDGETKKFRDSNVSDEEVDDVEEPEVEEEEEQEPDEQDTEVDHEEIEDSDDEFDLDNDPNESNDEIGQIEDEPDKETAVTQLRKLSTEHKTLKGDYDLQEETLVQVQRELDQAREELEKFQSTKIDPTSHPKFIDKKIKTGEAIYDSVLETMGSDSARKIDAVWGNLLTSAHKYRTASRETKSESLDSLRMEIAKTLGYEVEEDQEVLDPDIDHDALDAAKKVTSILSNHVNDYSELATIYSDLQSKAGSKRLEIGYKEYVEKTKPVREAAMSIATMDQRLIDEDPTSLQSLAARKIQRSPEQRSKFSNIVKMAIEMGYGPEALSQEELDKHAQSGKDMIEFEKTRNKRVESFRQTRLPEIIAALVMWPEIKEAMPSYFNDEENRSSSQNRKHITRKATKDVAQAKKKVDEPKTGDELMDDIRKALKM